MDKFTRNQLGLTSVEVGALKAVMEGYRAGLYENAHRNLPRRMFDSCQNYGKDRQGKHRPFDQANIFSAIAALRLEDEYELLEKLPELEEMGALIDPLQPPEPHESNLDIARAEL